MMPSSRCKRSRCPKGSFILQVFDIFERLTLVLQEISENYIIDKGCGSGPLCSSSFISRNHRKRRRFNERPGARLVATTQPRSFDCGDCRTLTDSKKRLVSLNRKWIVLENSDV